MKQFLYSFHFCSHLRVALLSVFISDRYSVKPITKIFMMNVKRKLLEHGEAFA